MGSLLIFSSLNRFDVLTDVFQTPEMNERFLEMCSLSVLGLEIPDCLC